MRAFHLHLDGEAPQPFEHTIGRLCEEFPSLGHPSAIAAEMDRLPDGFLQQLVEYRHYAACKAMRESATTAQARQALPDSPLMRLANEITFDLVAEAQAANEAAMRRAVEADEARRAAIAAAAQAPERRRRRKRRHG